MEDSASVKSDALKNKEAAHHQKTHSPTDLQLSLLLFPTKMWFLAEIGQRQRRSLTISFRHGYAYCSFNWLPALTLPNGSFIAEPLT